MMIADGTQNSAVCGSNFLGMKDVVENPEASNVAKLACVKKPLCPSQGRHIDIVVSGHADTIGFSGNAVEQSDVPQCLCHRLFQQDMLAGAEAFDCVGHVLADRCQHMHRIYIG